MIVLFFEKKKEEGERHELRTWLTQKKCDPELGLYEGRRISVRKHITLSGLVSWYLISFRTPGGATQQTVNTTDISYTIMKIAFKRCNS